MVYSIVTSTSAEASVAYAAPGDFAGEINIFYFIKRKYFVFRRFVEPGEAGRVNFVATATAKFEIRRGPFAFAVSPHVNGACSCSEGVRPPVRETSRFNGGE